MFRAMSNLEKNRRTNELIGRALVIVGLLIGLTANAYVAWKWSALFELTPGVSIRPMGAVIVTGNIAAITALVGLPVSITGIIMSRGWWRVLGPVAIILCLLPLPLMHMFFDWAGIMLSA